MTITIPHWAIIASAVVMVLGLGLWAIWGFLKLIASGDQ